MKSKLISITVFFAAVIVIVTAALYIAGERNDSQDVRGEQLLLLNEIVQLTERDGQVPAEKLSALEDSLRSSGLTTAYNSRILLYGGVSLAFVLIIFGYFYRTICLPFQRMQVYTGEIAKGNFELPLTLDRSNYFGSFTWAFDSMRREIMKARACEREAVENNKTVIATLSHDIKTPIASIRAYAEGLEAHLDSSPQRRARYLNMIMTKCDEAARLTDDLFLHSLADLDKLKIHPEPFEIGAFVQEAVREMAAERGDIRLVQPTFSALVNADKKRVLQILENLINNARKYAKSVVEISLEKEAGAVRILVRDQGPGIPDEDMPFIFDRFYRGKNAGNEQGSGLGLYIVRHLTEQMGGSVTLHNSSNGLKVALTLPLAE